MDNTIVGMMTRRDRKMGLRLIDGGTLGNGTPRSASDAQRHLEYHTTHLSWRNLVISHNSITLANIAFSGSIVKLYMNASRHARHPKSVICQ